MPRPLHGRRWLAGLLAGALSAALGLACLSDTRAGTTVVVDAAGRKVEIADASRIVSIGGAVTEILYALGLKERIVAIDSTSLYPPEAAREKPNVGYMRQLSAEGVLALNPSLVLAAEGSGPKETIAVLQTAAVPFALVPDHFNGEGVIEKIDLIARATATEPRGACLAAAVRRELDALAALRRKVARPLRVMFILSFMQGRPMAAGSNTAADGIIQLAGATNAITGYQGYKIINDEAVIAAAPEVVLVMQRAESTLTADTVFANPSFSLTPAAKRRGFVSMEGLYLLGFGPRTALAARDLAVALYPELVGGQIASSMDCQ